LTRKYENQIETITKKYENQIESLTKENKELNNRLHDDKDSLNTEIKKVMNDFNTNSIKNFNSCVEITKRTGNIAEILAKKCVNAKPVLKFTPENYNYDFRIDKKFIRRFLYQFEQGYASKFVGDYINGTFLKNDKTEQSLFSTDISRSNYTIKELIDEEDNKALWINDKGAIRVSELIVDPFTKIIGKYLRWYIGRETWKMGNSESKIDINYESSDEEEINEFYDKETINRIIEQGYENSDEEKIYKRIKKLQKSKKVYKKLSNKEMKDVIKESNLSLQILESIDDGSFNKDVIRYITKFYKFDKNFVD
jgi:hypothetical protein